MSAGKNEQKLNEEHAKKLQKAEKLCKMIRGLSPEDYRYIETEEFADHNLVTLRINNKRADIKDLCPNLTMNATEMKSVFKNSGPNCKNTKIRMLKDLVKSQTEDLKIITATSRKLVEDSEREVRLANYNFPNSNGNNTLVKELCDLVGELNGRVTAAHKQLETLNSGQSDVMQQIFVRPALKINCTIIPQRSDVPMASRESGAFSESK